MHNTKVPQKMLCTTHPGRKQCKKYTRVSMIGELEDFTTDKNNNHNIDLSYTGKKRREPGQSMN